MSDPREMPWADWMEKMIRNLTELAAERIAVVAFAQGQVFTGYYKMNIAEMQAAGGTMLTDAVLETVRVNFKALQEEAEGGKEDDDL